MRNTSLFALFVCVAVMTGCGGDSTPTISGTVHFDGQPISSGNIVFIPEGGNGTPFSGKIRNGHYLIEKAYTGKRTVAIGGTMGEEESNNAPVTRESMAKSMSDTEEAIDEKSLPENAVGNMQEIEVKAGRQVFDFELTSPPE